MAAGQLMSCWIGKAALEAGQYYVALSLSDPDDMRILTIPFPYSVLAQTLT